MNFNDIALDFVGTSKESGTKTYNYNFCKNLFKQKIKNRTILFITKKYKNELKINNKKNIKIITLSNIFENIYFRLLWVNIGLPIFIKFYNIKVLFSPMNISPIVIRFMNTKICEDYIYKCKILKKVKFAYLCNGFETKYRIRKNSLQSNRLKNIYWIWKINKNFNKLNFFTNLISIFYISLNSLKKYGLK